MKYSFIVILVLKILNCYCQSLLNFDNAELLISNLLQEGFNKHAKNNINISKECHYSILLFYNGLQEKQHWALKMVDSWAKVQSGILEGNINNLGAFDECISINEKLESKNILGQYCLVSIDVNKTAISKTFNTEIPITNIIHSICLPESCSNKDVEKLFIQFNISASVNKESCQTQNSIEVDSVSLPVIICFIIILLLMIMSTIYDYAAENIYKTKSNVLLCAFSTIKNGKKLFTVTQGRNEISCIFGIRAISMIWIILGHLYRMINQYPVANKVFVLKSLSDHEFDFVVGGTKAVDTFLLLSGLTLSYVFLSFAKNKKFNLPIFYLHRLLRLTPVLGAVILIDIGLLKFFSSGPYWLSIFSERSETCLNHWWKTLFYINNYESFQCLPHSWYLSVDMQLYIVSPIILILLQRKPKVGLFLTGFLTGCVIVTSFAITWIHNIESNDIYVYKSDRYLQMFYTKTYTRASPWFIGIIVGYLIYKTNEKKPKISIKSVLVVFLWVMTIVCLLFSVFYQIDSYDNEVSTKLKNSFYNAFLSVLWAVALGWVIFACCFGYGGVVNEFLSLPIFKILSRLTYTNYLIHVAVIYSLYGNFRTPPYFSHINTFIKFWGIYMYTQFASVALVVAFESPILTIEKILFAKKPEMNTNNST